MDIRRELVYQAPVPETTFVDADTQFHLLVDEVPVMLWMAGPDQRCTFVNREWVSFTGQSLAAALGNGWLDCVHAADRSACVAQIVSAATRRARFSVEYRLRRADGEYRWVLGLGVPRLDANDQLLGYVGWCADITDGKQQLRESEEQLRQLAAGLQTAREDERAHLARELHDELGQTLTAIKLELARATTGLRTGRIEGHTVDRIQSLMGLVDIGIATVKRLATNLRPATLDHLGLAAAIRWEASAFRATTGVRCYVRATRETTELTPDQQTVVFRIFQEALTNVVRHARASAVHVTLAERKGIFELRIRDNGRGIKEADMAHAGAIGLLGMRERAAIIGGAFTITGKPGRGTAITVRVPSGGRWAK
jgi:two-component system sensor histidine kinase UhpB